MAAGDARLTQGAQTPGELLAVLSKISDEPRPHPEFFKTIVESTADRLAASEELRQAMLSVEGKGDALFTQRMHTLLEHFPPELRKRLLDERNCAIGRVWTRDVNAHALRAGNGGWLIVVNEGLVAFVYKFLRALIIRMRWRDAELGVPPGGPTVYGANMIAIIVDWYKTTGFAAGPDFPVTAEQMHSASLFATGAENFVIAHELAHQVLDHPARAPRSMLVNATEVEAAATSPADEHEADTWGLRFILDSLQGQEGSAFAIAYAGVEAFFLAASVLEEYVGRPRCDTHPPADERLAEVRAFASEIVSGEDLASLTRLSDELNVWVDDVRGVLTTLEHPSRHPGVQRSVDEARAQFETLLEGAMSGSMDHLSAALVNAVMWRMWDIPADTYCELMAARFARAYEHHDADAIAELVVKLLPTGPLQRAVDERLAVPFLQDVAVEAARRAHP